MIQCLDELESSQSIHLDILPQPAVPQQHLQDLLVPDGHSHVERSQSSTFLQVDICPLVCQEEGHHVAGGLGNSEGQGGESVISLYIRLCIRMCKKNHYYVRSVQLHSLCEGCVAC